MSYTLFDSIERTDEGPADRSEPQFEYVNRTNRRHFQAVRKVLERWFDAYKASNADSVKDLWKRFRSKRNEQHLGALTELYLHHFLVQSGFETIAHPELRGLATRPEFCAVRDKKPRIVLEAVLVYDDRVGARIDKFEANVFDAINTVKSPDFLISFDIESIDKDKQPKVGAIARMLQSHIDGLSYKQVCSDYEKTGKLPEWSYRQDKWEFTFTASPVKEGSRKKRNDQSRVVGATVHGVTLVDIDVAIRDNVLAKSKKYGRFDVPFVIVVNVIRDSIFGKNDETIMEALWGREEFEVTTYGDGSHSTSPRRDMNGIWIDPKKGFINKHVSGILFMAGLTSATIQIAKPVLWHNPHAIHPVDIHEFDIEQRYFDKDTGTLKTFNVKEQWG